MENTKIVENVSKNSFMDSLRRLLLKNSSFIFLVAVASAAIFAGTCLFVNYHVGAFNDISVVAMLNSGLKNGDFAAAAAFGTSFLFARILEGPLVGVLDIGGSLMTGVGIGIPALLLASGIKMPVYNFPLALLTGALIGLAIGVIVIIIKKTMSSSISGNASSIMMGAGQLVGSYLGPLIIISAIQYSIPAGIGAFIGSAISYKFEKPITGGAIIGAMILGTLFPVK